MNGLKTYYLLAAAVSEPTDDPRQLFGWSVERLVNGFVDHCDYVQTIRQAHRQVFASDRLDRRVRELIALDINPVADLLLGASCEQAFERRWNDFNRSASLGVETIVSIEPVMTVQRQERSESEFAAFRMDVTAACLDYLLTVVGSARERREKPSRLQTQLKLLGITSAVIEETILHLKDEPSDGLTDCAARLTTSRRTLQRELASFGLTFRTLRQAVRLSIAGETMRAKTMTLTEIAQVAGFFDSAHLVRSWKQSCGLPPSLYRELAL